MKKEIIKSKNIFSTLKRFASEGWEYTLESKNYIFSSTIAFFFFIWVGFVFADQLTFLNEIISGMKSSMAEYSGNDLSMAIFLSNTKSAFFSLFLGILLGLLSIITLILNGTLVGYVMHALWIDSGVTHFWRLLPHGIFELPALFISWGLGIKLGMFIFTSEEGKELKRRLIGSLKAFLFIIIPLLLIAGFIEGTLITFLK